MWSAIFSNLGQALSADNRRWYTFLNQNAGTMKRYLRTLTIPLCQNPFGQHFIRLPAHFEGLLGHDPPIGASERVGS